MLIRALVVLDRVSERRRLVRLLETLDVLAVSAGAQGGGDKDLLARIGADTLDLLLIGVESLPDPVEGFFASLRRQPERPEAVVLRRGENAEARAALLGAGALAVLDPSSVTSSAPSPAPSAPAAATSSWPTAGPCSSTRSPR